MHNEGPETRLFHEKTAKTQFRHPKMYRLSKKRHLYRRINPFPPAWRRLSMKRWGIFTASVHNTVYILQGQSRNVKYKCTNLPDLCRQFRWREQNPPGFAQWSVFPTLTRLFYHAKISPKAGGGSAMKWSEMTTARKILTVVEHVSTYCTGFFSYSTWRIFWTHWQL